MNTEPKAIAVIVILLLSAILFPISFNFIASRVDGICYPIPNIPNLVLPEAYAWSYFFNTTNNRWYNFSSTTVSNSSIFFDGFLGDYDQTNLTEKEAFPNNNANDAFVMGEQLSEPLYNNRNITDIQVAMKDRDFGDISKPNFANDTIQFGIFNKNTGNIVHQFDIDYNPNSLVIKDGQIHLYNFTGFYAIGTNADQLVVGARVIPDLTYNPATTRSYTFFGTFYYKFNVIEYPPLPEPTGDMLYAEVLDGFYQNDTGYDMTVIINVTSSHAESTYTLIPYSGVDGNGRYPFGSTPTNSNLESVQQCQNTFSLLWLVATIAVISVIFIIMYRLRENR